MGFTSATMIDTQLNHATIIMIPGPASPDPDAWYFNSGVHSPTPYSAGNLPDVFTIAHLISVGH
jgi:hypothetical protein